MGKRSLPQFAKKDTGERERERERDKETIICVDEKQ
jgi:hypothetical protein